ncbi:porin [Microvirga terricola]|uniref:Porin n=1 Tax=Microvirga terricola TaxID=2719797 RepID=A0ABX0VA63_9HYPH|nr:porin [Microvirga terricola]NIX76588.1 porin [Microvirga terricola]
MKLVKSLMLGSVAGLAGVVGAQAADLPAKKAAPVEYVRVCTTYGEGFFYIPGTETCLRAGGRVRADYVYAQPFNRADDAFGFRARGRIQLDARTATAYGLLRTFVRFEITRDSGTPLFATGRIGTTPDVNEAFIQFGGLTAGRVTTFFDNGDLPTEHMGTLRFSDSPDVDLLAYTFTFGDNWSATISIEDGLERRDNGLVGSPFGLVPAGQRMPDVVANVKYTGTWGTAQLSGAVHQIRSAVLTNGVFVSPILGSIPDTEYGFAVQGNVGVNLPMLGAGDAAWVNVAYANGALGYITGGSTDGLSTGILNVLLVDAFVNPTTGDLSRGRGWSVAGGYRHFWTPQIRQAIFGSYARFDYSAQAREVGLPDFTETRLGTNIFWTPVSGLDFGAEVIWVRLDPHGRVEGPNGRLVSSDHAWEGRLRVQRDF